MENKNRLHIISVKRKNQGIYYCEGEIRTGIFVASGLLKVVCKLMQRLNYIIISRKGTRKRTFLFYIVLKLSVIP